MSAPAERQETRETARLIYEWFKVETARRREAWNECLARGGSPTCEGLPRPWWGEP